MRNFQSLLGAFSNALDEVYLGLYGERATFSRVVIALFHLSLIPLVFALSVTVFYFFAETLSLTVLLWVLVSCVSLIALIMASLALYSLNAMVVAKKTARRLERATRRPVRTVRMTYR